MARCVYPLECDFYLDNMIDLLCSSFIPIFLSHEHNETIFHVLTPRRENMTLRIDEADLTQVPSEASSRKSDTSA